MPESIRIAPSVLSADFGRLGEQVLEAVEGGADSIHLDVMDGHFVPNLTFGPPVIQALRTQTDAAFDVHMMVENPERYIPALAEARVDLMTVHVEAVRHLHRVVHQIKNAGILAGVALNPATPVSAVEEILPDLDLVLVMSVNPGFGGQTFIESSVEKIEHVRRLLDERARLQPFRWTAASDPTRRNGSSSRGLVCSWQARRYSVVRTGSRGPST